MQKIILIPGIITLLFTFSHICCCYGANAKALISLSVFAEEDSTLTKTVKLKITGMNCGRCANRIHKALSKKEGIVSDDISYPGDAEAITYNPKLITIEREFDLRI